MTAFFIGLILAELGMLKGWILVLYIIYCVERFIRYIV